MVSFSSAPNYESKNSYSVNVLASDGTNTTTQAITVSVTNINEAPSFSSSASFSAAENQTAIGSVSVSDQEGDSITYSLGGTDASSLAISSSGVVSFSSAPNYESKNSYSVNVLASDGTNTTTQAVTVNVTDVNDAPVATSKSYWTPLLPQSQTSTTWTLEGISDEDGDSLSYSIVSNGSYGTASINSSGVVTYTTASSTQSTSADAFTYKVNDGALDSSTVTISLESRTDPLYKYQWHLNNTGQTNFATNSGTSGKDLNVDTVISSGIDGSGIVVAIVDSGLEIAHEDLSPNVIANKSWDFVGSDNDPTSSSTDGDHGTSVAGIVAAKAWNKIGGRGVAPNAQIVGYNFLKAGTDANEALSLGDGNLGGNNLVTSADVDIFNMSYGVGIPDPYETFTFKSKISSVSEDAFKNGVANLRGNKGASYVQSSGNDWRYFNGSSYIYCGPNLGTGAASDLMPCADASFDPNHSIPHIISVGSLRATGVRSTYSTPGSSLWVSGFGGEYGNTYPAIMTTDQETCSKGYVRSGNAQSNAFNNQGNHSENSSCNYHSKFNGTSSAAPTVSGVIALMLEKNANLTWRDVKHILATTSTQVDASNSKTLSGITQYSWITNNANYKHHSWYGFGQINAAEAISAASSYTAGSLGTFVTTGTLTTGTINLSIASAQTTTRTGNISAPAGSDGIVEFVRIGLKLNHARPYDIGLRLTSPDGTTVPILIPFTAVSIDPSNALFEIGVSSLYGESMAGNWVLRMDEYTSDSVDGTLTEWQIEIYGH